MAAAEWGGAVRIAGRAQEQELLRQVVGGSVRGIPCTVLVHGEAGVGKTQLVTSVAERSRASGHSVLWARCLRFGAGSSPYLPFISAFEGWLAEGHADEGLDLTPLYGGSGATTAARALHVIDRAVAHLAEQGPVVLAVDDLQWADVSSLDTLAYLIAGLRTRPVALLVTYRDEGIPDGHVLHSWLADMLRMPGVVDLPLARLSLEETAEQLAYLLGSTPRATLVAEVWDRSGGNAYLTELLARDLDPTVESLPEDIPDALRSALLARWHSLSEPARELTQVLAVAGRPVDPGVLVAVSSVQVTGPLHEASVAGVVQQDRSGLVWFRHPLLSDVLYATLLPDQARDLHGAFVDVLMSGSSRGMRSHGDLALHFAGAERYDESFEHCLLAAGEAGAAMAYPEAAVLLRHACELWPDVSPHVRERSGPLPALLAESARIARLTGDLRGALAQLDAALPLLDEVADPLTAARVIRLRSQVAYTTGASTTHAVPDLRRAVEISGAVPDSEEHALALAHLSDAELWTGNRAAALQHAREAVDVAVRSGDEAARSYALGALANARMDEDGAEAQAREAVRLAHGAGRLEYVGLASIALANVLESTGRFAEAAEVLAEAHAAGLSFAGLTGLLGAYAAAAMVPLGRFAEARDILRDVLSSRPGGIIGIQARETAVVVAIRTGNLDEAAMHLERLRELAANFEEYAGLHGPGVQSEYLLATGRPDEALALLERTVEAHATTEPKYGDTLLLWAARAASALPPALRQQALDAVVVARQRARVPAFAGGERDPGQRAVKALFAAEVARCLRHDDEVDRWREALPLVDAAELRFAAADARLRLAEALLDTRDRRQAGLPLREAHRLAEEMGALRLRDEVAAVAAAARVALADPVVPEQNGHRVDGLTPRELEVLAHLVAGRSYGEIAAALFISEKTVSVHVSNLMRKTGTSSRVEAAAWARRSGALPAG
ncbi:MAG: helix-turn-helix transcriptional regulator [Nocardioides sp.]